jgi:AcrR family transcriptional regulator
VRGEAVQFSEAEKRILKAALKVVNEVTISGTRMHLIAEKADMVQSNVHYYYKTKDDLLEGLQEYVLEESYKIQRNEGKTSKDTLEGQLHIFFQQKKQMLTRKKEYDFAELDFIVQTRINRKIRERFQKAYSVWRDNIREIIIRYCPQLPEDDKELIPYLAVSLLEGASIQAVVDAKDFDVDAYFMSAEKMVLDSIDTAMKKVEKC